MLFAIHCLDGPESSAIRSRHFEAHKAYLAAAPVKVVMSGPLVAADGHTPVGSLFILKAGSLAEVEQMNREDPFFKAGLWDRIDIHPFVKRIDNRG